MKRHKSLIPLSKFHHKALFVALMSRKSGPALEGYPTDILEKAAYAQDFYYQQLRHHFRMESEELFSNVRGMDSDLDSIIFDLEVQRESIRALVEQLSRGGDLETSLDQLGIMLEAHIRKQERQAFQQIQSILSESDLQSLQHRLSRRLRALNRDRDFHPEYHA